MLGPGSLRSTSSQERTFLVRVSMDTTARKGLEILILVQNWNFHRYLIKPLVREKGHGFESRARSDFLLWVRFSPN